MDWWETVDWGSAPDWLAAVGTVGTLGAALWQLRRDRQRIAELERREAEREVEHKARQRRALVHGVVVKLGPLEYRDTDAWGRPTGSERYALATVYNQSAAPVHGVSVLDKDLVHVEYGGTVLAGDKYTVAVPESRLLLPTFITASFEDTEGNQWLVNSDGVLLSEHEDAFKELFTAEDP